MLAISSQGPALKPPATSASKRLLTDHMRLKETIRIYLATGIILIVLYLTNI